MATLEELAGERPTINGFRGNLLRVFGSVKRWHDRRQALVNLSRPSERQLRDVGFESAGICDSLNRQRASAWVEPHMRPDIR